MNEQFININGFRVFCFDSRMKLINYIKANPSILIAINAEKIYSGNETLRDISQNGLGYPDGFGAVMALRRKGINNVKRIPGSELWLDIISELEKDDSIYLVGSTQEVIEATTDKLKRDYPKLNLAGYRNGFLNENEIVNLERDIVETKPTVVFVAQGSPRQEILMKRLQIVHNAIYVGLGGSFNVYTGKTKRAPKFFRENGLEWLYRLISQPSRIKRQIVLLPFLYNLYADNY